MKSVALIVSLHDVAPATFGRVRRQAEDLARWGVPRTSLLAVPHYHFKETLTDAPEPLGWLRDQQAAGHEIVLHGWFHRCSDVAAVYDRRLSYDSEKTSGDGHRPPLHHGGKGGIRSWFFENLYTNGEAEFLNLGRASARDRIARGARMLREAGLNARGFVAPAWLMNPEVEQAAKEEGILYTQTISELVRLSDGRRFPARACVWSSRAAWRRLASRAWNASLFRRLQGSDPLRIALHPIDVEYPAIWGQIERLVRAALETRRPATYGEWMDDQK